jgi:sodium-dependent dicarboxylate transporter 2/3/5
MEGFVLACALTRHSLDKFLAQKLIGLTRGNFHKSFVLLMLATSMIFCWVSNTLSTAMMLPLGVESLPL